MTVPVRRFEVRVVSYCLKEGGRSASMYYQGFRLIGHSLDIGDDGEDLVLSVARNHRHFQLTEGRAPNGAAH
jgi:hypothetical protein